MTAVPPAASALSAHAAIVTALAANTKHRRHSGPLVRWLMTDPDTRDIGRNVANCALRLQLEAGQGPDDPPEARVTAARVCNSRLCPYCEWRRSRVLRARLLTGAAALYEADPVLRPLVLTLTVRNCPIDGLRDTLALLHSAWHRMVRRRNFPTALWYRRTEITVSDPAVLVKRGAPGVEYAKRRQIAANGEVTLHPHLHCLLFVRPSYFGRDYIKHEVWREMWRQCLGVDYDPIVDIRRAYGKTDETASSSLPLGAAMECSKYITKQADLPKLGPLVSEFHHAVRGVRMRGISRDLAQYINDREPTAADLLDSPLAAAEGMPLPLRVIADWCDEQGSYIGTLSGGGG